MCERGVCVFGGGVGVVKSHVVDHVQRVQELAEGALRGRIGIGALGSREAQQHGAHGGRRVGALQDEVAQLLDRVLGAGVALQHEQAAGAVVWGEVDGAAQRRGPQPLAMLCLHGAHLLRAVPLTLTKQPPPAVTRPTFVDDWVEEGELGVGRF